VQAVKQQLTEVWIAKKDGYVLGIEPEVFWRRGGPPKRSDVRGTGEQVNAMSSCAISLLIVGIADDDCHRGHRPSQHGQARRAGRRHLSSDQTFREWSHDSNSTDKTSSLRSAGR